MHKLEDNLVSLLKDMFKLIKNSASTKDVCDILQKANNVCPEVDLQGPVKVELSILDSTNTHYGDPIPIKDWIDRCVTGEFIDYDGHGVFYGQNKRYSGMVFPSFVNKETKQIQHLMLKSFNASSVVYYVPELINKALKENNITHVIWFNR